MNRDPMIYALVGGLVGGLIVWILASTAVNNNMPGMMRMMGMRGAQMGNQITDMMEEATEHMGEVDMGMSMDDMMESIKDKTGDAFDRAFVAAMIIHHQGAINMAELAKANAKHDEVKALADDIIAAQTREIDQMKAWQESWGY